MRVTRTGRDLMQRQQAALQRFKDGSDIHLPAIERARRVLATHDARRQILAAAVQDAVLSAHVDGEFSNAQLAELLGVSRKSIESMCQQARQRLDAAISDDLNHDDF